ncbi:hybrid sensor histidine kinase/response regulator [Cognatiluteimonas lumbrici]|uniref:hybrid sensor histidine kinase/response regulator n=1 Tax=Cognatiluteimonas lumbrici TaxID=2559601 RepID=UPI001FE2B35C|nr:ATP-binding protein [Luteimonas lumbrici]
MRRVGWLLSGMLALWVGLAAAGVPEVPRLRTLGVADGLPATGINAIVRDQAGYVWIGTADGLARYDGIGFRVWRNEPGNPQSLPGNTVQALHVDARDRLWIATESGGLSMLDPQRRRFTHYRMAEHPEIGSDDTWAIASQGDVVWFGTYAGGVHRLDPDGRITRFMPGEDGSGLPAPTVLALLVDAQGVLWAGTMRGLARWTGDDFERVSLPGPRPGPLVFSLSLDGDALWVGASTGVFRRSGSGRWVAPSWSPMFEQPNAVQALVRDRQGQFWIGSQLGLWRVRGDGIPVPVRGDGPGINKAVAALLLQDDGALWAPVTGVGLGYLRADWRQVAQFSRRDSALGAMLYRGIGAARAGGFWLAPYGGAPERIGADGSVTQLSDAAAEAIGGSAKLLTVAETADGVLWAGTRDHLARVVGDEVRKWFPRDKVDALLPGLDLLRIAPDGSLWLSCNGSGVQQRDARSGRVLRSWKAGSHGLDLADNETMEFAPDGTLWLAGDGGVRVLRPGAEDFERIAGMGEERVYALALDGGSVWLSRRTGLEHYRRDGDGWRRVARIAQDQGIPAVEAAGMVVDGHHRVWLSTSRGLFRWDPGNGRLRRLGIQEGLGSQEFEPRSIALSGGVLAATTTGGSVVMVDVNLPDPKPAQPRLHLDEVAVRRDGRWEPVDATGLQLPPDTRELRVRMRLLDFADPAGNRYESRLQGVDADWLSQGSSGERVFSGLAPGDYALALRARNAAGEASEVQVLQWSVQPPWWRTPWALAGFAALALLLLGWAGWAWRAREREREELRLLERERALAEEASLAKSRFLATLGHEVRTPMTGVLGMGELLLSTGLDGRQRGYVESIRDAGHHLLRLVNDALDLARIEAGKLELDPQPFDLRELVDDVVGLHAPLARQRGLAFACEVDARAPAKLRGDPVRIRQILFNLLGNAIKFTQQGEVGLRVEPLGREGVRFVVRDTGPGLNEEQRARLFRRFEQADGARTASRYGGSGLGLAISQELAAAMGGRIDVASSPGVGTRFSVELPLEVLPLLPASTPAREPRNLPAPGLDLLLVEDDPTVAEVLRGLLQSQGHRVAHAAHGLGALAEATTRTFDMALLDLDLPGMDGLSLAAALRGQGFAGPLVAVTARADAAAEPEARAAGFDAFLRKPLTGAMLARVLEGLAGVDRVDEHGDVGGVHVR